MLRNQHRLHNASVFSRIGNVDLTIAFPNLAQIQNTLVFTLYGQLNGFICELEEEERKEAKKKRGRTMEDWINQIKQLVETRLIEARRWRETNNHMRQQCNGSSDDDAEGQTGGGDASR